MAKCADRYFKTKPWEILEEGFDPNYSQVSESIFSLGNEYMGIRGFFEEGYKGKCLIGSYFNGVFEEERHSQKGYKGDVNITEYMVNSVNWLYVRICAGKEELNLANSKFSEFVRKLDLKTGILERTFIWETKSGEKIYISFERFLSMDSIDKGVQKITCRSMDFQGELEITMGLDFSPIHVSTEKNVWNCSLQTAEKDFLSILGETETSNQKISSNCKIVGDMKAESSHIDNKKVSTTYKATISPGEEKTLIRIVDNRVCKTTVASEIIAFEEECRNIRNSLMEEDYDNLKREAILWWKHIWETSDIVIQGDDINQQGIRYCIFQMFQTYHGAVIGTSIGAKGLTGEAYNGNAFWDTETYCLPFYIFNNREAAKNLLMFRHETLGEARNRAKELDCQGAFYPVATISGKECCNLWQHASLQLQASTAVAYGIWFYEKITRDTDFLFQYGAEMLVEISRMLVTRGDYAADGKGYGFYCVMGPDEFQMMVNNNCYTNYMGRFTLEYANEVLDRLSHIDEKAYKKLVDKINLKEEERVKWKKIAEDMNIPLQEEKGLYEQHDGYFKLPHVDVDSIPMEQFPLYNNWSYDRIYRNNMIKQPDVLMLMLLFNSRFTQNEIKQNYEYYEPKCIHESSLSPSVHSILASQLGKHQEAYEFFQFATRMDLDNYNRNSEEGLHTTSIAAAWMNIIYGFGGMRSDGDILEFAPSIPAKWEGYNFRITYDDSVLLINVNNENSIFSVIQGDPITIKIYGKIYNIGNGETIIKMPGEWRETQ